MCKCNAGQAIVTNFEKYFLHMMNVEHHLSAILPHTSKYVFDTPEAGRCYFARTKKRSVYVKLKTTRPGSAVDRF